MTDVNLHLSCLMMKIRHFQHLPDFISNKSSIVLKSVEYAEIRRISLLVFDVSKTYSSQFFNAPFK